MEKEQLYEYAGRLRRELHALVDQHMDDFVKRIGDGNLSSKTVMACSLADRIIFLKGRNLCRSCCQEEKNGHAKRGGRLSP